MVPFMNCGLTVHGIVKQKDWHLQEVYDFVKSMQPDCQISTNWTIGKRPVDMQEGDSIIYFLSDFRLWDPSAC